MTKSIRIVSIAILALIISVFLIHTSQKSQAQSEFITTFGVEPTNNQAQSKVDKVLKDLALSHQSATEDLSQYALGTAIVHEFSGYNNAQEASEKLAQHKRDVALRLDGFTKAKNLAEKYSLKVYEVENYYEYHCGGPC